MLLESVDWFHLIQVRVEWQVLVNSSQILRFHERQEICLPDAWLV
jgi:hypothetical protein